MTVTQDYKTITLTVHEAEAVRGALARECAEMHRIASSYGISNNLGRNLFSLIADLQTALVKVRA